MFMYIFLDFPNALHVVDVNSIVNGKLDHMNFTRTINTLKNIAKLHVASFEPRVPQKFTLPFLEYFFSLM